MSLTEEPMFPNGTCVRVRRLCTGGSKIVATSLSDMWALVTWRHNPNGSSQGP